MTIREAIRDIDTFGDEIMFYGIPGPDGWKENDECLAISEPLDVIEIERDGKIYHYFLEVETIREVMEGWENISRRRASEDEVLRVVIYYAIHDSWPAP